MADESPIASSESHGLGGDMREWTRSRFLRVDDAVAQTATRPAPGLVSVVVPTYNRADLIVETLDSIFAQTYRPIELIVIDDGSTDDTEQVVRDWKRSLPEGDGFAFRYFREENRGAPAARNKGLMTATGEYLQFIDSDDLLSPDKLRHQLNVLEEDPSLDIVFGDWRIGPDWNRSRPGICGAKRNPDLVVSMLTDGAVAHFAYLARRSSLRGLEPWDPSLTAYQDLDFFGTKAARGLKFRHLPEETGLYRLHDGDQITKKSRVVLGRNGARVLEKIEFLLRERGMLSRQRAWSIAHHYLLIGREAFAEDPEFFRWTRRRIEEVCPGFVPRNFRYRWAVRVLGYEGTQRLWNFVRRLRRDWGGALRRPRLRPDVSSSPGAAVAAGGASGSGETPRRTVEEIVGPESQPAPSKPLSRRQKRGLPLG